MYIVRWLTHHPIVAIWALTIIALLLSMGGGKTDKTNVASNEATNVVKQSEPVTSDGKSVVDVNTSADNHSNGGEITTAATTTPSATISASDLSSSKTDEHLQKDEASVLLNSLEDKATDDLLLMAREAFWNNGLDEAISIYQQLVQREPKVMEHKGELANVYWKQGFSAKAAGIYAEIAIPMIEIGKADRVESMVGFIKQYHPEKAVEIEKHLQGLSK